MVCTGNRHANQIGQRVKYCCKGVYAQYAEEVSHQQGCSLVALDIQTCLATKKEKERDIFESLDVNPTQLQFSPVPVNHGNVLIPMLLTWPPLKPVLNPP